MRKRMYASFAAAVAVVVLTTASLHAQGYTQLYNFNWHAEGANPNLPASLAQAQDGNLYSTLQTQLSGRGSVVSWSFPNNTLADVYNFKGKPDGDTPQSGLTLGLDGSLYGTTELGGTSGFGSVFKVSPTGVVSILYSFTDGTDGGYPWAPPIQAPDGNIYGVTNNDTNACAYKITPSGVFSAIATLPSRTQAPLILGTDGNLYGTTPYGGTYNRGTVYQLTTKGKLKIIHSFTAEIPSAPVMQGADGKLYGTGTWGGANGLGTVYTMTISGGSYKVLHDFATGDGSNSSSGLVQGSDKYLYGVTESGGANSKGTLFKVNTTGTIFSVLHNFGTTDGATPMGTPTLHTNGLIYGTTNTGGTPNPLYGVLFSYNANLKPFASIVIIWSGKVGTKVGIIGQGFDTATGVKFGTASANYTVVSDTYLTATVPAGATTAAATILEPTGNLVTPQIFKVIPTISSFSPSSGPVGTSVVITGVSLTQTTAVTFGTVKATTFTVNSDTQVTAVVPTGAVTGKVKITTKGGIATSAAIFTVQ